MNTAFETLTTFQSALDNAQANSKDGKTLEVQVALAGAVSLIQKVEQTGKKVIIVGNGGSAAIASHQSVDLWKNGGIRSIAFNDASLLTCAANDFGYPYVFSKPIEMFADKGDLLIAISSSGKSENILNAVKAAQKVGCEVITYSGFSSENPLRKVGGINFFVDSPSYGIVEVAHLLMIHSIIDEIIRLKSQTKESSQHASQHSQASL